MALYFRVRVGPFTYVERLDEGVRPSAPATPPPHRWQRDPAVWCVLVGLALLFVVLPIVVVLVD